MSLDADQIEEVRDIIGYSSISATELLVSNLTAVQETRTIADIALWDGVKDKFTNFSGGKFAIDIDKSRNRLAFRNRVRQRLGLPRLLSEDQLTYTNEILVSTPVIKSHRGCREDECP